MGRVARFGVYVETIGTFGVFIALAIFGFHQGFGFIFSTQNVEYRKNNPLGLELRRQLVDRRRAGCRARQRLHFLRIRVRRRYLRRDDRRAAPSPQSDAQRTALRRHRVVRAGAGAAARDAGVRHRAASLRAASAAFSPCCRRGSRISSSSWSSSRSSAAAPPCKAPARGWRSRWLATARLPFSDRIKKISPRHHTPANAILIGTVVPFLFLAARAGQPEQARAHSLVRLSGQRQRAVRAGLVCDVGHLSRIFPYRFGALIARLRGWKPSGAFTLGRWGVPVTIAGALYLLLMLLNIVWPSALEQRARDFQLRLGDAAGHGDHRRVRRGLRSDRASGSQCVQTSHRRVTCERASQRSSHSSRSQPGEPPRPRVRRRCKHAGVLPFRMTACFGMRCRPARFRRSTNGKRRARAPR